MDASPSTNSYLSGNYAPVRSEDDYELEVVGEFPSSLRGAFYRNGPNPQFEPRGDYHWFTGDGMIHAFFVDGGKVAIAIATSERQNGSSSTRRARRCSAVSIRARPILRRRARTAASPTPTSSGTRAGFSRSKKRTSRSSSIPRASNPAAMSSLTRAASPPIPRSIPRPARWPGLAIRSATGGSPGRCPMA